MTQYHTPQISIDFNAIPNSQLNGIQALHCTFLTLYRCMSQLHTEELSQHTTKSHSAHNNPFSDLSVHILYNLLILISSHYFEVKLPRLEDSLAYEPSDAERDAFMRDIECNCSAHMHKSSKTSAQNTTAADGTDDDDMHDDDDMLVDQEYAEDMNIRETSIMSTPTRPTNNSFSLPHSHHKTPQSLPYHLFTHRNPVPPREILADCLYYAARLLPALLYECPHTTINAPTHSTTGSTTLYHENPQSHSIRSLYQCSADLGRVESMHRFAWICMDENDLSTAVQYYRRAISCGHVPSMVNLGYLYEKRLLPNDSVTNPDESPLILSTHARLNLYSNRVSELHMKMALHYYYLAAQSGSGMGWCNMGTAFKILAMYQESVECFNEAIKLDYSPAFVCLGRMFETGRGITQSTREALKCYVKAAEQGNVDALVNIGLMYQNGEGTRQSLSQALTVFEKAVQLGDQDAEEYVTNVKRRIVDACTCIGRV